jgi:hypothetical protein
MAKFTLQQLIEGLNDSVGGLSEREKYDSVVYLIDIMDNVKTIKAVKKYVDQEYKCEFGNEN